ncbi:MAG: DUF2791 family P-loop domain-containing protein [Blastocatellia bacterium]|nr:DUF2791 family P-loop domain-containing protein [Blastocatellia bacterium]
MIGSIVNHPLFGRGRVRELRNAAREAVVRFDNGIRTVVPASMLSVLEQSASAVAFQPPALPIAQPREETPPTPERLQQIEARHTIEALRYGVVPSKRIRELSVGLDRETESLHRAFEEVERNGGDVRVVLGEYGAGKSHFFELAESLALERNFLVTLTSLDVREVPPNRPQRIYHALMRSLRYPDSQEVGTLSPLLDRIVSQPKVFAPLVEKLQGTLFATVLYNYSLMRSAAGEGKERLLDWIAGEKMIIKTVRDVLPARGKEFPLRALSMTTTSADQYCYLLNGWGWLATQVGYAGLVVLIDESEHYSLLNVRSRERADNFFKAMIYTAMASHPDCRLSEADLEHQRREHPFRLADKSHLLLMFAVTPSANTFDYRRWLSEEQILPLEGNLSAAALDELMARLYVLHRQAYSYDLSDRYLEASHGLLECLENGLINLRQTIRLATEIFDLCYAYPDFSAEQAVAELRRSLLGEG